MKDCNHKYFISDCVVCWFKLGHGIDIKYAPIRGDEGSEKHRQDCINIGIMVSEEHLRCHRRSMGDR